MALEDPMWSDIQQTLQGPPELGLFTEWDDVVYPPAFQNPVEEVLEPEWLSMEEVVDEELDRQLFGSRDYIDLDRPLFEGWGVKIGRAHV